MLLRGMGKKRDGGGGVGYGINKKPPPTSGLLQHGKSQPASLRQQSGRRGAATTPQALKPGQQAAALRADHLLRIATWASANVPPLGALLGARLGCLCEAAGVPVPETSHSICQRCESIMQVGVNCSVRVAKSKRKGKSNKAKSISNYVTYICHFCKHGNAKPGTSKKHLKTKIAQAAARSNLKLLGNSLVSEADKATSPSNQQGTLVEDASVQKSTGPEAVETSLDKEPPSGQESAKAPESVSFDPMETSQQAQEGPEAVEMGEQDDAKVALDMEMKQPRCAEHEAARIVDVTLAEEPLKYQPDQESARIALIEEPLDVTEKSRHEQDSAEAVVGLSVLMETSPQECPEFKELVDHTVKDEQGQEGMKSTLNRLPLDLSSKKKRKKKTQQQGVVEQEGVKMSLQKGLVVESNDNAKKKKRKGWSSLKELVPFP